MKKNPHVEQIDAEIRSIANKYENTTLYELNKCQEVYNQQYEETENLKQIIGNQVKELNNLHAELSKLRNEKRVWLKVCRFEKKRQEKFYEMMFIDQTSEFADYLRCVKELAEYEE